MVSIVNYQKKFLGKWVCCETWTSKESFFCVGETNDLVYVWYCGRVYEYSRDLNFFKTKQNCFNDTRVSYKFVETFKGCRDDDKIKWIR